MWREFIIGKNYIFDFVERVNNKIRKYKPYDAKKHLNHVIRRLECCKKKQSNEETIGNINQRRDKKATNIHTKQKEMHE